MNEKHFIRWDAVIIVLMVFVLQLAVMWDRYTQNPENAFLQSAGFFLLSSLALYLGLLGKLNWVIKTAWILASLLMVIFLLTFDVGFLSTGNYNDAVRYAGNIVSLLLLSIGVIVGMIFVLFRVSPRR